MCVCVCVLGEVETGHGFRCQVAGVEEPKHLGSVTFQHDLVQFFREMSTTKLAVLAGANAYTTNTSDFVQTRQVKRAIRHPSYRVVRDFFEDDLTLLELSEPLDLGDNITSICLAADDTTDEKSCFIGGWETNEEGIHRWQ